MDFGVEASSVDEFGEGGGEGDGGVRGDVPGWRRVGGEHEVKFGDGGGGGEEG